MWKENEQKEDTGREMEREKKEENTGWRLRGKKVRGREAAVY